MVVLELHGSGGHIFADVTDEQAKKADLGVGKYFLAPIGKLKEQNMQKTSKNKIIIFFNLI